MTPTTEQQTIVPDEGYNALTQIIVGEIENLKDTIDVQDTLISELQAKLNNKAGISAMSATAYAGDIAQGKTAYCRGEMLTGTMNRYDNMNTDNVPTIPTNLTPQDLAAYLIKKVIDFDCSNQSTLTSAFTNLTNLEEITFKNTENVTQFQGTFSNGNSKLKRIGEIDCSSVAMSSALLSSAAMAYPYLTDIEGFKDLGKARALGSGALNIILTGAPNLTHESLMNIINKIYDLNITYAGETIPSQEIKLANEAYALLTADEIAIATAKGWLVTTPSQS